MRIPLRFFFLPGFFSICPFLYAQTDSLSQLLDDVTVTRRRVTSPIKGEINGTFRWDMGMMHDLPKILGNADPMHYTQLLPGVQTCSEYDSGLHIQGCDNAHNYVSISDVPLYNVSHMLGFFSIFNASHFPQMEFTRSPLTSSSPNRLGGFLSMTLPNKIPESVTGEFSIGPMSSQGTFRLTLGGESALHISLRATYLNLLYGKWLEIDGSQLEYGFQDYNLTYLYKPNASNTLTANLYYGDDNVKMNEDMDASKTKMKWGNLLASLEWQRIFGNDNKLRHTIYYTGYANRFAIQTQELSFRLPSHIQTWGYKGMWNTGHWKFGTDAAFHHIQPQKPTLSGSYHITSPTQPTQQAQEYSIYSDFSFPLNQWFIQTGLKGNLYVAPKEETYASADPSISLSYTSNNLGRIKLSYGWQHQYLFQTGFSSMGLPTEFWFSSGNGNSPQYAQNLSLAYDMELLEGNYQLSVELYHKQLWHQVEYNGNLLNFLYTTYDLNELLLKGKGENYGINIMLNKRTGSLTGWISYAWGRAFRSFDNPEYTKRYPASHERIHELNVVGTYRFNERWSVGGTCVFASGTPFTAPKHFLLVGGMLVSEYGEFNANRLKPYFRLDLSANYNFFSNNKRESGINFSLYNATCRSNNLFYRLKFFEGEYGYKPVRFLVKILPSVNYYYKF